jgi:hypothetical protein
MYYWLLSTTGNPEEPKSEESADFLNRVIGSNDPVFSRWAITTVWPQMAGRSHSTTLIFAYCQRLLSSILGDGFESEVVIEFLKKRR